MRIFAKRAVFPPGSAAFTRLARVAGFASAASFCSRGSRSTRYQIGIVTKSRLAWSRLKLMSIGRVCTWGQTRAPRVTCSETRARTRETFVGAAAESNSGENVVGIRCASESSASSTRASVMSVS
jgi:hypothetical protein